VGGGGGDDGVQDREPGFSRVPAFREERGAGGRRDDSLKVGR
jgi:hypothetical protein